MSHGSCIYRLIISSSYARDRKVFTYSRTTLQIATSKSYHDWNVSTLDPRFAITTRFMFNFHLVLVENPSQVQNQCRPSSILERDVTLTSCYNQTRVLILQHSQNSALPNTEIAVYTISK